MFRPISKQEQFLLQTLKRLVKSPFFYCFLAALLFAGSAFFLLRAQEGGVSFKRNVFDSSQYLFAEQNKISANINLNIIEGAVLQPSSPAFLLSREVLGAAAGIVEVEEEKEITKYIVKEGDTLSAVADKFGISLETLLWANNLTSRSLLKMGQELVILPTSGFLHIVTEGDTLSEIAELYQVKAEEISDFNGLSEEGRIYAGDLLIVPGGKKPKVSQQYVQVPLSQSYFICPIPSPCVITQGLHWFNAVDFSNSRCGEPVFAAAGGTVQKTGQSAVGGNYVRILHPNGVITYYGHLSKIAVAGGSRVYQGQVIGYVGYTGVTVPAGPAGCHLHFDVRFAQNPFSRYMVGAKLGG